MEQSIEQQILDTVGRYEMPEAEIRKCTDRAGLNDVQADAVIDRMLDAGQIESTIVACANGRFMPALRLSSVERRNYETRLAQASEGRTPWILFPGGIG